MKLIYPTLLQAANKVNPNSWFKLLEYTNTNYKNKQKVFNISSFFLLLLLLFINLNIIEILRLLTITCVSWLYHSNREMDAQVLSYIYTLYNSQCNITLALLIIFNITNVIYRIILQDKENVVICFIIVSGIILAYIGYQGMSLSGYKHKITNWIEIKKIAWHGGMGLIASGLLINSKL